MAVMVSGRETETKFLQLEKVFISIEVTPSGITIELIFVWAKA